MPGSALTGQSQPDGRDGLFLAGFYAIEYTRSLHPSGTQAGQITSQNTTGGNAFWKQFVFSREELEFYGVMTQLSLFPFYPVFLVS